MNESYSYSPTGPVVTGHLLLVQDLPAVCEGVVRCIFLALMCLQVSWSNKPEEGKRFLCVPKTRNHTGKTLVTRGKCMTF